MQFIYLGIFIVLLMHPIVFVEGNNNNFGMDFNSFFQMFSSTLKNKLNNKEATCTVTNNKNVGLCITPSACTKQSGNSIGSCNNNDLGGVGVCCIIPLIGSSDSVPTIVTKKAVTIKENKIENSVAVFEFPKDPEICQLSLQFLNTKLANPSVDILNAGNCIKDSVTIAGSPSFLSEVLQVCGDMTDQHMHLAYDDSGFGVQNSDKITITVKTSSNLAQYSIGVSQVRCDDPNRVAAYCLQQYIEDTGIAKSFGYPYQLNNQYYHMCTKGLDPGVKTVTWSECTNTGNQPFFITGSVDTSGNFPPAEYGDIDCSSDYLYSTLSNPPDRHCGGSFPRTITFTNVGHMTVHFDQNEIGYTAIMMGLPPSVAFCSDIFFPGHNCAHPLESSDAATTCICTLDPAFPLQLSIPILAGEVCPTFRGYVCSKTSSTLCNCLQSYNEADQENTGFCLRFTHSY